jgi:hypothetical protein
MTTTAFNSTGTNSSQQRCCDNYDLSADLPAELARARHPAPAGIAIRSGAIAADEILRLDGMPCTTAARTAYDLGRRLPVDTPSHGSTPC